MTEDKIVRSFVAIDFAEELQQNWVQTAQLLASMGFSGSWTHLGNFHLTLAFLGELPSEVVQSLWKELRKVLSSEPFELHVLDQVFYFRKGDIPRVLWVGTRPSPPLEALFSQAGPVLKRFSVRFHPQFSGHVTLGRIKRCPEQFQLLLQKVRTLPGTQHVQQVHLYQSTLSSKGALYRRLDSISLA
ncbi:MAG TPA: RNA 2',3'-cyclic phosphodiesterase [Thermotogota bacterium]|nr:RNA 2',3'-cyclic phosphodiesterase [Thermotogota bacterium]